MCQADFLGDSVPTEEHLCKYIRNVIDDADRKILQYIAGGAIDSKEYKNFNIDIDNDGITTAIDSNRLNLKIHNGYGNDSTIVGHPGIEMTISEKGWIDKGESYSLEQAYYLLNRFERMIKFDNLEITEENHYHMLLLIRKL